MDFFRNDSSLPAARGAPQLLFGLPVKVVASPSNLNKNQQGTLGCAYSDGGSDGSLRATTTLSGLKNIPGDQRQHSCKCWRGEQQAKNWGVEEHDCVVGREFNKDSTCYLSTKRTREMIEPAILMMYRTKSPAYFFEEDIGLLKHEAGTS